LPTDEYEEYDQGDPAEAELTQDMMKWFSESAVRGLVIRAAYGSAPGHDRLCKEMLGLARGTRLKGIPGIDRHVSITLLSQFFQMCLLLGCTPTDWSISLVVPLYKGKGARTDWANWRPISLMPFWRKLFEKGLAPDVVRGGFHSMQGGFRPAKSTLDQVAGLDHACHIAQREGKDIYMAFLDIWAAYDTVDRNRLWAKERARGTSERVVRLLSAIARRNTSKVIGVGRESKAYCCRGGVPQGGTLSPHHYNVVIDDLCMELEAAGTTVLLGGQIQTADKQGIDGSLYADDVALVSYDVHNLQYSLHLCEDHSRRECYRWKPSKSEVVASRPTVVTLYGEKLVQVKSFMYLGVPLTSDGLNVTRLLDKNITRMRGAVAEMRVLGVNAFGLAPYRCILAWKAFVRSCLEYGLAIVDLTKGQMERLERAQCEGLRCIFGAHRSASAEAMRLLAEAEPMAVRQQELQARFLVRAIKSEPLGSVKRWLGDALNDRSSRMRRITDRNEVLQEHTQIATLGLGPRLPSLWTMQEQAALAFDLRLNRPWSASNETCRTRQWDAGQNVEIQRETLIEWRRAKRNDRLEAAYVAQKDVLARDLPPVVLKETPLRYIRWKISDCRRLVSWWLGSFPSHRPGVTCGVCGAVIPVRGGRAHVASCASTVEELKELPLLPNFSMMQHRFPGRPAVRRVSSDPITITIWLMCDAKAYNEPFGAAVRTALKVVGERCLGRRNAVAEEDELTPPQEETELYIPFQRA
jgi:hypothetical protein